MKTRKNVWRGLAPACGNGEMVTRGRDTRPLPDVNNLGIDLIITSNVRYFNGQISQSYVRLFVQYYWFLNL